ncbi:SRPBCC family protein [Modestobacter sp. Leaf380]|uniref:SRPBCC family protein n=1 Tax=Modestobacter sp. Leaf380 TaxID=1736356 RepID=UPI000701E08B|nr:SRPBCC family protein [Modestobacter sp. Leaf380]KQS73311.1 hypothetical protein ASG41_01070 [Modestobacter sp. Leaf380]
MARTTTVSDSTVVDAPPAAVWAVVADPTRTPGYSPENRGARTPHPGPLAVGEVFTGRNERFGARWTTECVVTAADPEQRFAFRVRAIGLRTPRLRARNASWEHRLEPVALPEGRTGTRVTQTWTDDRRWPDALAAVVDRVLTRSTFAAHQQRNLASSLRGLRTLLGA